MVPRPIGAGAPKCTRCDKSVFMAEQTIGPHSRPYHKSCLTCVVCNKRLDSTLLLEHDGEPYCKNCHKTHLGQGKGGFGLSVPLRPEKPIALQSKALSPVSTGRSEAVRRVEDRLNEEMSGIAISARRDNPSPVLREPALPPYQPSTRITNTSRPTTVAQSIDDLVSSGVEVPVPYRRNAGQISSSAYANAEPINVALYGEDTDDVRYNYEEPLSRLERNLTGRSDRSTGRNAYIDHAAERDYSYVSRSPPKEHIMTPSRAQNAQQIYTPSRGGEDSTIGSIAIPQNGGLPSPQRKDPVALTRERERGAQYGVGAGAVKTYSPRTTPVSPPQATIDDRDRYAYSPDSALTKMGLGSTVNAAVVGTPLCARCERPVYFAEQKQAAGRKWHRGCLRCDGCSATLESGRLEEGPLSATYKNPTNIWCRTCYAKRFGPKGIGVAGMSLPETMT